MKFGKQYAEALSSSTFPAEWRANAIEYKQLKKVINQVAAELQDAGLTPDVLRDLLAASTSKSSDPSTDNGATTAESNVPGTRSKSTPTVGHPQGTLHASYYLSGTSDSPLPQIRIVISSGSSSSSSSSSGDSSSDEEASPTAGGSEKPKRNGEVNGITERMVRGKGKAKVLPDPVGEEAEEVDAAREHRKRAMQRYWRKRSLRVNGIKTGSGQGSSGIVSEVGSLSSKGSSNNPPVDEPIISPPDQASQFISSPREESGSSDHAEADPYLLESTLPKPLPTTHLRRSSSVILKQLYGVPLLSSELSTWGEVGPAPGEGSLGALGESTFKTVELEGFEDGDEPDVTPSSILSNGKGQRASVETLKSFSVRAAEAALENEDADDEFETTSRINGANPCHPNFQRRHHRHHHHHHHHRQELVIPLANDTHFLRSLSSSLASLSTLQSTTHSHFSTSVQTLARDVSKIASPTSKYGVKDLYTWREVFTLWIEAEIWEPRRGDDRRAKGVTGWSVEESEKRLKWFVGQVGNRGLGKKMKTRESRGVLEKFVALNVRLGEVRAFEEVNSEALRKLLKKHDKRTALSASTTFPLFLFHDTTFSLPTLPLPSNSQPTLPHLMLTTMTNTLLPVLPSLEDYECGICAEVAFKPIRLGGCGHRFCLRCLVKMQKRGQGKCPLCRADVVMAANATNLDVPLQQFLQMWFPKEVKEKTKADNKEARAEELDELELDGNCIIC